MSDPEIFIKGYKVDRDKLKERYGTREDDPNNTRLWSIWQKFPHEYLYFSGGMDERGGIQLVVGSVGEVTSFATYNVVYSDGYGPEYGGQTRQLSLCAIDQPCVIGVSSHPR